jgi:hypothetical protein
VTGILFDLVAAGLDVEGLDVSSDMLERCRRVAELVCDAGAVGSEKLAVVGSLLQDHLSCGYRSVMTGRSPEAMAARTAAWSLLLRRA